MKKNLLSFILFLCFSGAAFAQSLTVDDVEINISGDPSENEFYEHTPMTNNLTEDLDLRWVRTIESMPAEWDNYFCTVPGNCGLPNTDSLSFTLGAGEVGDFQIHFAPNGVAGSAVVIVDLIDEATDAILETITINVETSPVSVNELEEARVRIFPNPATHFFQVENGEKVDQIAVFNILGQQVKFFENPDNRIFVGDLAKGMYMIRLIDLDSNSSKTLTLKKN